MATKKTEENPKTENSAQSKSKTNEPKTKDNTQASTETKSEGTESNQEEGFWSEARESVIEGARIVGETVSEYSGKFVDTIRDKSAEAFKLSSEFTMDAVHRAQGIIDEYRDRFEVRKLSNNRDKLTAELGLHMYRAIKDNKNELPEKYMDEKEVKALLKEIEKTDEQILSLEGELKK